MIQLSILKISEYGPWTLTLGSDREHELQMLQASLYKEVQKLFSEKNCLVFLNRADEFFVVSKETLQLKRVQCSSEFLERGRDKVERAVAVWKKFFGPNRTHKVEDYIANEVL